MQSVGSGITNLLSHLDPDKSKALHNAQNNAKFELAVRNSWRDNPDAAEYILAHTNGIYIKKDEAPRKGVDKDKSLIILGIYMDDSLALAELNARRELLHLKLAQEGMHVQEIKIHAATRGMKERHLFPQSIENLTSPSSPRHDPKPAAASPDKEALAQLSDKIDSPALAESFKKAVAATLGVVSEENPAAKPTFSDNASTGSQSRKDTSTGTLLTEGTTPPAQSSGNETSGMPSVHNATPRVLTTENTSPSVQPVQNSTSDAHIFETTMNLKLEDESRKLEILKRAFCQVFEDDIQALAVLERIEGASLDEVASAESFRTVNRCCWCHLYTSAPDQMETIISAHQSALISRAHALGLNLRSIKVHLSPAYLKGKKAFPRSGSPLPLSALHPSFKDNQTF